jgi:trehalose 6-phosphate synthase/phosphatase
MEKAHSDMLRRFSIHTPHLNPRTFLSDFRNAQKRLFLLDYDGTLVPYERSPSAPVSPRYIDTLKRLTADPRNLVYILSGRGTESLVERLGEVPNLGMRLATPVAPV